MSSKLTTIIEPETEVLIVDDNIQYTQLLCRILSAGFGYQHITTVCDPHAAYELIRKDPERFKLLFVDYRFPEGATGGDLLTKLNADALLADKIAFLITSEPTVDNQKEALRAGAMGVVAKPFDREIIKRQIDKAQRAIENENGEGF